MKLYISGLSILILLIFYMPLVLFILWRIVKSNFGKAAKVIAILVFLLLAYAIPLGDVTVHSMAMAKVCPNAGLHVYKQVKVDGYFDPSASDQILDLYPYQFIEYTRPGARERIIHVERSQDKRTIKSTLDTPAARYEIKYEGWGINKDLGVSVLRDSVINRNTNEVLGERLLFNPIPGWLDRVLVLRWFGGAIQGCHGQAGYEFRSKILVPNNGRG